MQTAAIISKNRQLDIKVELNLHEWIPDLSFRNTSRKEAKEAARLCKEYNGVCRNDIGKKFENLENVFDRTKKVLLRYCKYKKIIVMTHEVVICRFSSKPDISFCGITEIYFDESFSCTDFKQ